MTELIIKSEEGDTVKAQMLVESRQGQTIYFYLPSLDGGIRIHVKDVQELINFLNYQIHSTHEPRGY